MKWRTTHDLRWRVEDRRYVDRIRRFQRLLGWLFVLLAWATLWCQIGVNHGRQLERNAPVRVAQVQP